jgi:hypothetical protein
VDFILVKLVLQEKLVMAAKKIAPQSAARLSVVFSTSNSRGDASQHRCDLYRHVMGKP